MTTIRLASLVLPAVLLITPLATAQSPTAPKRLTYPVEVTVLEIDQAGKKTSLAHELLIVPLDGGAERLVCSGKTRLAGTKPSNTRYAPFDFNVCCLVGRWDKDRIALRGVVEGEGQAWLDGPFVSSVATKSDVRKSKLLRVGDVLKIEIPRDDLIPGDDVGGRFVFRFRLRAAERDEE